MLVNYDFCISELPKIMLTVDHSFLFTRGFAMLKHQCVSVMLAFYKYHEQTAESPGARRLPVAALRWKTERWNVHVPLLPAVSSALQFKLCANLFCSIWKWMLLGRADLIFFLQTAKQSFQPRSDSPCTSWMVGFEYIHPSLLYYKVLFWLAIFSHNALHMSEEKFVDGCENSEGCLRTPNSSIEKKKTGNPVTLFLAFWKKGMLSLQVSSVTNEQTSMLW